MIACKYSCGLGERQAQMLLAAFAHAGVGVPERLPTRVIGLDTNESAGGDKVLVLSGKPLPSVTRGATVNHHHEQLRKQLDQPPQRVNPIVELRTVRGAVDIPWVHVPRDN